MQVLPGFIEAQQGTIIFTGHALLTELPQSCNEIQLDNS